MTDDEWNIACGVLKEGWPGDWSAATGPALKVMLGSEDGQAVLAALHKIARQPGRRFRPSVSEILGELSSDPGLPTWPEVHRAIFGGGINPSLGEHEGVAAADVIHPALGMFVALKGWRNLMLLEIADPRFGPVRLRDLENQWRDHVERHQEREAHGAALSAVGRRGTLGKLEPLAALGLGRPEIEA